MSDLSGRTYVVTGGSSGIGAAIVHRLRERDAAVIVVDRANDADVRADLSSADGVSQMCADVASRTGGVLDAVVASAGVLGRSRDEARLVIDVNYFGAVRTLSGLRPLLERGTNPRALVLVSTGVTSPSDSATVDACLAGDDAAAVVAAERTPDMAYASSKRALARWVRRVAPQPEWAGARIPLNALGPGRVATPMTRDVYGDAVTRAEVERRLPMPLGGPATPDQIAPAVDWLCSPENSLITGQCVFIDGGTDALRRGDDIW